MKRGDSEAVAYAFHHLKHWKQIDGALNVLHSTWEGTFRCIPVSFLNFQKLMIFQYPLEKGLLFFPYPANTEAADRDLLPFHHVVSVFPKRELPFFIVFCAALFTVTALLALLTHQVGPSSLKFFKKYSKFFKTDFQYPELVKSWVQTFLSVVSEPFNWLSSRLHRSFDELRLLGLPSAWGI